MGKKTKIEFEPVEIISPDAASDETSRKLIAGDLANNILVEAVPGSGKTYNLIKRLVAMVTSGKIPANRIAAITFTRKAAEELRTRFQEEIASLLSSKSTVAADHKMLQMAALEIEDGYIGTIHGFCGAIIRQYPIEAGIDPTFREIDPDESVAMLMNTWSRYLDAHPELIDLLNAYNVGTRDEKLINSLLAVAGHLDVEFPTGADVQMPDLNEILNTWDETYQNALACRPFADINDPDWSDQERKYWQNLDRKNEDLKLARATANIYQAWYCLSFAPGNLTQKACHSAADAKKLVALIRDFYKKFEEFSHKFCTASYKELLGHFCAAAQAAALDRRQRGCLDFVDLLSETAKLLKNNPKIRQVVAARYPHLLVDEFQDTDPIQAQIIFLLADPTGSSHWRECRPKPGSLFVVGDPKQAIYRFRRGDVDTYKTVRSILEETGARILTLQANWRSQPDICTWVNNCFGNAFAVQQQIGQINFAAMAAIRKTEKHPAIYRLDFNPEEQQQYLDDLVSRKLASACKKITLGSTPEGNMINARKIGLLIKEATSTGRKDLCNGRILSPQDFLIVARTNDVLTGIAIELENRGIPTSLSGGGYLLADSLRQDFLPLYWLLRAISLPTDSALLYVALTTPFFGFSEEDLYRYIKVYERLNIFNETAPDDNDPVALALRQISRFNAWQREYPAGTAFRKIVREIGIRAWLQTRPQGEFKIKLLNDVEKMFDASIFRHGIATLGSWISSWPSDNRPAEPGTVNLMTIFRAKGLEAPVVIIAGLPRSENQKEPYICTTRDTDPPHGHVRIACRNGEHNDRTFCCSPEWTGLANAEKTALALEEMRKDYVAATRARDCLIVCGMSNKDGKVKTALRSDLLDYTSTLPVLDVVLPLPAPVEEAEDVIKKAPSKKEGKGREPDFAAIYNSFAGELKDWYKKSAVASCRYSAVTELTEAKDKSLFSKKSDGGKNHGSALHAILDTAMQNRLCPGPNLETELSGLVDQKVAEDDELDKKPLLNEARTAIEHPIWQEAQQSEQCFCEAPVAALEDDLKKLPIKNLSGLPLRLNATIDLVYKVKDGWKIVDYKTDRIDDDLQLKQLTEYHAGQLKVYAYLWEKLTGEKVIAKTLLFVNKNCAVSC